MSRPRFPGGFGYAINYDREIALDRARVEGIERLIARGILKPDSTPLGHAFSLRDALLTGGVWLERLGISEDERHALAWYYECSDAELERLGIPTAAPAGNWYRVATEVTRRVEPLAEGWGDDLPTLARAKNERAKAKADLARHTRNRAKWGRP